MSPTDPAAPPHRPDRATEAMVDLLGETVDAVSTALAEHRRATAGAGASMREPGERDGQYRLDLVADDAALAVLESAGVGVLSEESGLVDRGTGVIVVLDPVDGSTNASRGIPWFATSLCAVDEDGPWVALVADLAGGTRHTAVRGAGAWRDGEAIHCSSTTALADALVVLNGLPPAHLGWRQYRALGATALDLCAVASGAVDATIDCTTDALGPWDYLGGLLLVTEAGGRVGDVAGRELVVLDHDVRRSPVAAATAELFDEALSARRSFGEVGR